MSNRFITRSMILATTAIAALAAAHSAAAQEAAATPDATKADADTSAPAPAGDIIVTGSRVKGDAPVGSALIGVGREEMEQSNTITTSQLFLKMPQVNNLGVSENNRSGNGASANFNFSQGLNVHGVGPYATLILVDGQRVAPQGVYGLAVDTSIVPVIALERMELVPDGSSAIYGSDAIAGVANLILRRKFEGVQATGNYGFADNYREYQAGIIAGVDWGSGRGTLTYNFNGHSPLRAIDRSFARSDLRDRGGTDYRATQCNPGTIVIGGVNYAIPAGGVTPATAGSLVPNTTNRCDNAIGSYLIPRIRQHNVVATFDQNITDNLSISATGIYSRREAETRGLIASTTLTIPTTNAFYTRPPNSGAGTETIRYSFADFPRSAESYGSSDFYHASIGAKLDLSEDWQANAAFTYGGSIEHYYQTHNVSNPLLVTALASSDPATAFNPYGGPNSAAVLDRIGVGLFAPRGRQNQDITDLGVTGTLFRLPGGDVRMAVGYQHFRANQHSFSVTGTVSAPAEVVSVDFTRRVDSGYAELLVPIVGPGNAFPGAQSIQLDLAARYDKYSDVGSTTNPKVGINWEIVDGLKLHGSYGTSFRAPPLFQSQGIANSIVVQLPDPQAGGALVSALEITGGSRSVRPETATTWSAGLELSPRLIRGLSFQLSYFNIRYRDIIIALGNNSQLLNQGYYGALGIITRNPTAQQVADTLATYRLVQGVVPATVPVLIDARTRNLSALETSGLDLLASYKADAGSLGEFEIGVTGSYFFNFDTTTAPGAPKVDLVGTILNPPRYQMRPYVGLHGDAFNIVAAVNITDSYKNNLATPVQKVSSYATVDLHLDYDLAKIIPGAKQMRLGLNVTNLFDKDPPFVNIGPSTYTEGGYDSSLASPVGRLIALQLVAGF